MNEAAANFRATLFRGASGLFGSGAIFVIADLFFRNIGCEPGESEIGKRCLLVEIVERLARQRRKR